MKHGVLIVDDKEKLCTSLQQNFEHVGYDCSYALTSAAAFKMLAAKPARVVLLDVALGSESGVEVLKSILKRHPTIPVIMITGYGTIETAVQSIKLGAYDYVQKPLDFNKLLRIVENAIKLSVLHEENLKIKSRIKEFFPKTITHNGRMLDLISKAERLASTDLPVLITGESGTGKEHMAEFIHNRSSRSSHGMLSINCAAFPEHLLDNELFGHERGAFTGADARFVGLFEKADKTTLFLDEIGDMQVPTQAKILRTLQNKEIRRIGSNETIIVDVRFIAATNKSIESLIQEKRFREDLSYRLNTAVIHIPPLRERKEDVPLLVDYLMAEFCRGNDIPVKTLSPEVHDLFMSYPWPGNIRELKNVTSYAAAISHDEVVGIGDLPPSFSEVHREELQYGPLEESERTIIVKTLQKVAYNKKEAAELLRISRKTLYNKLSQYGILTPPR